MTGEVACPELADTRFAAAMKYLLLVLLIVVIAGVEIFHELRSAHAPDATLCIAPEKQRDALREMLFQHLGSH
ncbi:MAG: hypothetical protein IT531_07245 [Burkholderiales bacterium]|nr:hypothetical protein [Burkholderiales bacterium]